MTMRSEPVRFRSPAHSSGSSAGECVGDLYLPPEAGPHPTVVMAHGIAAERSFGLTPFVEGFVARGLAVLIFDYRNFGPSSGEPRNLVSPIRHVADYHSAIDFVQTDSRLHPGRLALWGTSFSGGHALVTAARRTKEVRAVVAQIPFVSGISSAFAYPFRYHVPALALGLIDALSAGLGYSPVTVPVVRQRGLALLPGLEAHTGYMGLLPPDSDISEGVGRVPARILLTIMAYHPIALASRVEAPVLIIAARDDRIIPVRGVRRTAARIPQCRLEEWPIGHFDIYSGQWLVRAVELEADFLAEHLQPPPDDG